MRTQRSPSCQYPTVLRDYSFSKHSWKWWTLEWIDQEWWTLHVLLLNNAQYTLNSWELMLSCLCAARQHGFRKLYCLKYFVLVFKIGAMVRPLLPSSQHCLWWSFHYHCLGAIYLSFSNFHLNKSCSYLVLNFKSGPIPWIPRQACWESRANNRTTHYFTKCPSLAFILADNFCTELYTNVRKNFCKGYSYSVGY